MKVVNYETAKASGRRFRHTGPLSPDGHAATTGHIWRLANRRYKVPKTQHSHIELVCTHCNYLCGLPLDLPDTWILEETEEELFKKAEDLLNGLGIRVKDVEKISVSTKDRN